jgi:hypothetical protein
VTAASVDALKAGSDYLAALNAAGGDYLAATAVWLDVPFGAGQDQLTRTPEPDTLLLLGTGLATVLARPRRRSQT